MSASERLLTREEIEEFRGAICGWIPGRVANMDRSKYSNNPSLAIQHANELCDLALRALGSDNAVGQVPLQSNLLNGAGEAQTVNRPVPAAPVCALARRDALLRDVQVEYVATGAISIDTILSIEAILKDTERELSAP